jgi:hypothetical protein
MDQITSLIIGIGVIFALFSIFGISFKVVKLPKWKKLDFNKTWGPPGGDLDQWCRRNPGAKKFLTGFAQVIVWLWQFHWWLFVNFVKAVLSVTKGLFKKAVKVK